MYEKNYNILEHIIRQIRGVVSLHWKDNKIFYIDNGYLQSFLLTYEKYIVLKQAFITSNKGSEKEIIEESRIRS